MHLDLEALENGTYGTTLENVGFHPDSVERLLCACRIQVLWTGKDGDIGINRIAHNVPNALKRLVMARDEGICFFPGCDRTDHLQPHHVQHWTRKGPTNLKNLKMGCPSHHTLMHEGRWSMIVGDDGEPIVFRPSGRRYIPDLPGTELKEEVIEKEMSRAGPDPGSLEERYGIKNYEFKETVAGLIDELYEVAKHLVDDQVRLGPLGVPDRLHLHERRYFIGTALLRGTHDPFHVLGARCFDLGQHVRTHSSDVDRIHI
jgi:hypothetical protein